MTSLVILLLIAFTFSFILGKRYYSVIDVQGQRYAQNMKNFEFHLKNIKYDVQHFGENGINNEVISSDDRLFMLFQTNVPIGKVASEQEQQIDQVHQNLMTFIKYDQNSDKSSALKSINLLIDNLDQINQKMKNKSNYYWYTQLQPN